MAAIQEILAAACLSDKTFASQPAAFVGELINEMPNVERPIAKCNLSELRQKILTIIFCFNKKQV